MLEILAAAALMTGAGASAPAPSPAAVEVRFCPEGGVWTYPLNDRMGLNSLVVQATALVNGTPTAFEADSAELDLLSKGEIKESRRLSRDDLAAAAGRAAQNADLKQALPGLFCGDRLLGTASFATTTRIGPGQALLVARQTLAASGPRDTVRFVVHGTQDGRPVVATGDLAIRQGVAKTAFHFPLKGTWTIGAGPSLQSHHRWATFEEFAYDIVRIDAKGLTHTGDGMSFSDYYAFGAPVLAAADGMVVEAFGDEPESTAGMQQTGESDADYAKRARKEQADRLARGEVGIVGDHVVLDHGDGEYSLYAHMQPGSVAVKPGQKVKAGEPLGRLGSSGNSSEPHLHFQVCAGPDPLACAGIPVRFVDVDQDMLQSGDVIVVK